MVTPAGARAGEELAQGYKGVRPNNITDSRPPVAVALAKMVTSILQHAFTWAFSFCLEC
jgi:hypothetical protein